MKRDEQNKAPEQLEITPEMKKQLKAAGFKGEPVIARKFIHKGRKETGHREHDIAAGNIAFLVGEDLRISTELSLNYFKLNFIEVKQ